MYVLYWFYESEVTSVASDEDFRSHASGSDSERIIFSAASGFRMRSRTSGRR